MLLNIYIQHHGPVSEYVKGALRPGNAKRLYTDEKSTEIGEIKSRIIGKYKGEKIGK